MCSCVCLLCVIQTLRLIDARVLTVKKKSVSLLLDLQLWHDNKLPDPLGRHAASETTGVETTSFLPRVSWQASTLHYGCSNLAIGWEPIFFYHFIFLPFFT